MLGEFYAAPEVHFILEFTLRVLTLLAPHHLVLIQGTAVVPATTLAPLVAATLAPMPTVWTGIGCPGAYIAGAPVAPGASVSVAKTGVTLVYTCNTNTTSGWCPLGWIEARDRSTLGAGLDLERILHRHTHAHLKSYHPRANVKSFQLIAQPGGMSQRICSGRGIQGGGYGNQEWNGIQVQCRSLQSFLPHGSI